MSAWTYRCSNGKAGPKIVPPRLQNPMLEGPWCRNSEEKHEPASGVRPDTLAQDQPHHRRNPLATHGRSIHMGLGRVKTRRRGETIEWIFFRAAIEVMRIASWQGTRSISRTFLAVPEFAGFSHSQGQLLTLKRRLGTSVKCHKQTFDCA